MKKQGSGKIVNMSSTAFLLGVPMFLHYATSKAAIVGLTRSISRELGEFNITVYGDLTNTITGPTGLIINSGNSIDLNGTIASDAPCSSAIDNAFVRFIINSSSNTYYCPSQAGSVTNTTGNFYNCTWDTTGIPAAMYDITMESWKSYYNNGSDIQYDAINITRTTVLNAANVTPEVEGWGINKTFFVNVTDPEDNATVRLWIKQTAGTWAQVGSSQLCDNCTNQTLNWTYEFTFTDVSTTDGWEFKFNATDGEGNSYSTTGSDYIDDQYFTVEKNDVNIIYISGNETITNKTSSAHFIVLLNDTDRGVIVTSPAASTAFNVTINYDNYTLDGTNNTNATGYAHYYFTASCTYDKGKQKWRAYIPSSDSYFRSNPTSAYNVTLDIYCPEFNVTSITTPTEAFQYKPFGVIS